VAARADIHERTARPTYLSLAILYGLTEEMAACIRRPYRWGRATIFVKPY
jgi:hypothetical protein